MYHKYDYTIKIKSQYNLQLKLINEHSIILYLTVQKQLLSNQLTIFEFDYF